MIKKTLVAVVTAAIVTILSCMPKDIMETRKMPIESIDLAKVGDGTYQGAYSYAGSDFLVQVTVKSQKIEKIDIIKAYTGTPYSIRAQAIIDTVIAHQSLDVDVITGATTTSKAYLKCTENALKQGIE
jgi:uncharacterized protein with FMN-binding domain